MNIIRSETAEKYGIIPVKTYESRFWSHVYEVSFGEFGHCVFLVNAENEQEALDELVDYPEETGIYPGYLAKWDDEHLDELRKDAVEQGYEEEDFVSDFYVGPAGNHGIYLSDPYQTLQIERLI